MIYYARNFTIKAVCEDITTSIDVVLHGIMPSFAGFEKPVMSEHFCSQDLSYYRYRYLISDKNAKKGNSVKLISPMMTQKHKLAKIVLGGDVLGIYHYSEMALNLR